MWYISKSYKMQKVSKSNFIVVRILQATKILQPFVHHHTSPHPHLQGPQDPHLQPQQLFLLQLHVLPHLQSHAALLQLQAACQFLLRATTIYLLPSEVPIFDYIHIVY